MMDYGMKQASVQKRKVASVARGNRKAVPAKKVAGMKRKMDALSKMQAKEVASRMGGGKMYAGGSRDFNERTGTYRSTGKPVKRVAKPVNRGLEKMPRIKKK